MDQYTQADSLVVYRTGAQQTPSIAVSIGEIFALAPPFTITITAGSVEPHESLGGAISPSVVTELGFMVTGTMTNIRIDRVSGACGSGVASIEAAGTGKLRFTAPGGSASDAVEIANGETLQLTDPDDPDKFIVVTRCSSDDLYGQLTITMMPVFNNAVGLSNVSSAERTAGVTKVRCIGFTNKGSTSITQLKAWLDSTTSSTITIAKQTQVEGLFSVADDENDTSELGGLSFSAPTTEETAIDLGTLAAAASVGLWIKNTLAADTEDANARLDNQIHISYYIGADKYTHTLDGSWRIADADKDQYELYRGVDAEPDLSAAPWQTFSSLPYETPALAVSHTYYFVLRKRNAWDLVSQNIESWIIEIAADGSQVTERPDSPTSITLTQTAGPRGLLQALYIESDDTDRATHWAIWCTYNGTDPDPDVDEPTEVVTMRFIGPAARLSWQSNISADGTTIKAIVRSRRVDSETTDSDNTSISSLTIDATGPDDIDARSYLGRSAQSYGGS